MKADKIARQSAEPLARKRQQEESQPEQESLHPLARFQRAAGNRAVLRLLESSGQLQASSVRLQAKPKGDAASDEYEREAEGASARAPSPAPAATLQRKCATCSAPLPCSACAGAEDESIRSEEEEDKVQFKERDAPPLSHAALSVQRAPREGAPTTGVADMTTAPRRDAVSTPAPPLLVGDDAAELAPGQMRKSDFLAELRSVVCATADEALATAGRDTRGCPYIERWLAYYRDQEPARVERALRRYAPEAEGVATARDYIPAVSSRVRRAVERWAQTGEVIGVPEEMAGLLTGGGGALGAVAGMIGGALSGLASGIGSAVSAAAGAVGGAFSSISRALLKRKECQSGAGDDPREIQTQLGGGQPLDGGVNSRLGPAFDQDFSGVRVHTDAHAASLSDRLGARAFTVGSDIAFGAGEYQPGTLVGDALIAHELAHVVQQGGGAGGASAVNAKGEVAEGEALEDEADDAAVAAVTSAWGDRVGALRRGGRGAMSGVKSGLRLQRCSHETYDFELYRRRFNHYWTDPAYNTEPVSYDPTLGSKGPRSRRAWRIFNRIYNDDPALRSAYDRNVSGARERIDTYMGPEGLNTVVGPGGTTVAESPRLQALEAAFRRFDRPVSGGDYRSFSAAVRSAATGLDEPDRRAVETSNDWQRFINDYVTTVTQRNEIRAIIARRPPTPPLPPQPQPQQPPASADEAQAFVNGVTIVGPTAPVIANGRDEQVTLTPHSTIPNPSVVIDTRFTVTPADRVRDSNISPDSCWPAGAENGVPFQPRIINTSDVTMNAHLELVNGVGAPTRSTPIQDLRFEVRDNRLANFLSRWRMTVVFSNAGGGTEVWSSGATVRYRGGSQIFYAAASLQSGLTNPGLSLSVRGQIMRGGSHAFAPTVPVAFPPDQNQSPLIPMPMTAPNAVPASGDPLTFQVDLYGADGRTIIDTKTISFPVLPEATYTQAQAEAAAAEDDDFFRRPSGFRGMLRSLPSGVRNISQGVATNAAEGLDSGRLTLIPITMRHDSGEYVTAKNNGRPDPKQAGWFAGTSYTLSRSDPNSFVASAGAAAFTIGGTIAAAIGRRPEDIVMNRTTDVSTNNKRSDEWTLRLYIHEAVHSMDQRPDSDSLIERYKTEFRAYWMDGRYGPPDQGTCPPGSGVCFPTDYNPLLPPPGPKSPRARAIFEHLYNSETYDFVKQAYDNNTNGFRQRVDNYLIPDGINLRISLRLEALRQVIEGWNGFDFPSFRARVRAAAANTDAADWDEINRNRAWRDLVERKVEHRAMQEIIKSDLGIQR